VSFIEISLRSEQNYWMQDYPAYKGQIEGYSEGNIAGNELKIRIFAKVSKLKQVRAVTGPDRGSFRRFS